MQFLLAFTRVALLNPPHEVQQKPPCNVSVSLHSVEMEILKYDEQSDSTLALNLQ